MFKILCDKEVVEVIYLYSDRKHEKAIGETIKWFITVDSPVYRLYCNDEGRVDMLLYYLYTKQIMYSY